MCRPQTTNREMVVNCKKNSARLPESSASSQIDGKRILDRWPHLLRRAILDAGSAMLDYDFKYFLLRHAIFFIPLTFVFGMTGLLQWELKCRRLLSMDCRSFVEWWWCCAWLSWIPLASWFFSFDFWIEILTAFLWPERSNENGLLIKMQCKASNRAKMQATGSIKYLMFNFSFRADFAADSACGMLAWEVPRRILIIVAAHIMNKRVSGQQ